jgi:hypothetical protein
MQKKDDEQLKKQHQEGDQAELSNVWKELLGLRPGEDHVPTSSASFQQAIPLFEGDPWTRLLEAENIEMLDLQQAHLSISECEVEQMLQLMQEQTAQDQSDGKKTKN